MPGFTPKIGEVRDVLGPLGLADAKVAILEPTASGQANQVRVQAEILADPVSQVRRGLADAAGATPADVTVTRTGPGASWTVAAGGLTEAQVRQAIADVQGLDATVTVAGGTATVTTAELPPSPVDQVTAALADYGGSKAADVTVNTVGPTWGETVTRKALQALLAFFVLVIGYLSFRFEWKMALSAVIAVLHDIIVTVGVYAVFGFQVTPATVTAFLTILGFSLYDTVVVFDKVRENTTSLLAVGRSTYSDMVNRSLNQVLMRSLSTSLVALLPVASLLVVGSWILGAVALEDFALALFAGLFIGTYSSLFVATPILAAWKEREDRYVALRRRVETGGTRRRRGRATIGTAHEVGPQTADATAPAAPAAEGGVPGPPPAVVQPRPRQQRRRKRR